MKLNIFPGETDVSMLSVSAENVHYFPDRGQNNVWALVD